VPFTPFHLGPALAVGLPLRRHLHAPTFVLANVIVDVEPLMALLAGGGPLHGFFHTFLGAAVMALILAAVMVMLEELLSDFFKALRLEEGRLRPTAYLAAAISGTWLHVLLDATMYPDVRPFWPSTYNPFYHPAALTVPVYAFCVLTAILGLAIYVAIFVRERKAD